LLTRQPD